MQLCELPISLATGATANILNNVTGKVGFCIVSLSTGVYGMFAVNSMSAPTMIAIVWSISSTITPVLTAYGVGISGSSLVLVSGSTATACNFTWFYAGT